MEITVETNSYNERRYGKPWIALVDFTSNAKGVFTFGDWIGDERNGGAGILEINANPGDIIAQGQKDNRKPRNSAPNFYEVLADGSLSCVGDRGAAYKHYKSKPTVDKGALMVERETLMARIAEIDNILGNG